AKPRQRSRPAMSSDFLTRGKMDNSQRELNIACIGTRGLRSNYSGIEIACESLYTALAGRGHKITVYCRAESRGLEADSYRGIRRTALPAISSKSLESLSHNAISLLHASFQTEYHIVQ